MFLDVEPVDPIRSGSLLQYHPLLEILRQILMLAQPFEITKLSIESQLEGGVFGRAGELIIIFAEKLWSFRCAKIANFKAVWLSFLLLKTIQMTLNINTYQARVVASMIGSAIAVVKMEGLKV